MRAGKRQGSQPMKGWRAETRSYAGWAPDSQAKLTDAGQADAAREVLAKKPEARGPESDSGVACAALRRRGAPGMQCPARR